MGITGRRFLATLCGLTLLAGCADFDKAMRDLDGRVRTDLGRGLDGSPGRDEAVPEQDPGGQAAQPASAPPGSPTAAALSAALAPAGSCEGSCDHYLGCKRITDPASRPTCIARCVQLLRSPQELAQFEALPCPQAIVTVEGVPAARPQGAAQPRPGAGARSCPAPLPAKRSPDEEKLLQLLTTRVLCGWEYHSTTGSSKEMRLRFLADGTMIHQYKTERSGNTTDGWGNVTGSFGVTSGSGDSYCWRYAAPEFLYSADGASFSPFVTKVTDNGNGVVFFQTRLGEFKVCD